jgi:all-trans-8'-apo-beta-carotenal 15,15'-oxygenase
VAALSFPGDGKPPFFANRLVRTQAMVEEQQAGRMLYRGAFSVGNPAGGLFYNPFDLSVKKIANTGVVHWANRIMALYERDMPYELTGPDLRTKGQTDCGGAISEGPYFAAHYRIVNQPDGSRRLIGFNSRETGMSNDITVWELDEEGRQLHKSDFTLPDAAFGFFHDLAVTDE